MKSSNFFPYIRLSLGTESPETFTFPEGKELRDLLKVAKAQGLQGLLFSGLDKIDTASMGYNPKESEEYGRLIATSWQIEKVREVHIAKIAKLVSFLRNSGKRCCLLKGVGLGALYDEGARRQPGDVDLWVEGPRGETLEFLEKKWRVQEVVYHHCDVAGLSKPNVEFHFTPSWMFEVADNRRLQNFFREHADAQFSNMDTALGLPVPTEDFNLVFVMVHIYRHLFDEGLKIKQFVDYFYLLKHSTPEQRAAAIAFLKSIHMGKFVAGVMSVLIRSLAMPGEWALCPPDATAGAIIESELDVFLYATTINHPGEGSFKRVSRRARHRWGLLRAFPREVLAAPFFKSWQYIWRLSNGYFAK